MPSIENIRQQLASLRSEFSTNLIPRVDQLITNLDSLENQADPLHSLQEIFRQLHSLSGSAGSFGFNRLGEQSRQLELILKQFTNSQSLPDSTTIDQLKHGLQKLHPLIAQGADDELLSEPSPASVDDNTPRQLYVVKADSISGHKLCSQLNHYGFQTRLFATASEVGLALDQAQPDALVFDIDVEQELVACTGLASNIALRAEQLVPFLFITTLRDWASRLAAVQAGGEAYLIKPVDITTLVNHLDRITQRVQREPYRVLLVDDARELAQHYALTLRQAGIHAEILTEPASILETMESFKPELILLDIYFPEISGIDIAQVLRQHQRYFSIPIIFLSTEIDPEIQLKTLQQGDDFLEKPILESHLVNVIETRIERARGLGQLMYDDGLTGLFNRNTLKRRLKSEFSRSQRQAFPLSFIMLDLDHFNSVNDRYGYTTGDQVLISLAQVLKDRLRQSDQVGRYGGDKFGIIMPDTPLNTACQIMDDLREHFSQLIHQSHDHDFSISFSAGIACASEFDEFSHLIEAADEALYLAKQQGRNQLARHKDDNP